MLAMLVMMGSAFLCCPTRLSLIVDMCMCLIAVSAGAVHCLMK